MRSGLALIRVSKVGGREDLISPELQRSAIGTYAKGASIQVVDWIEALDESGSQKNSPWWRTLDTAISRVEAERLDCILVWKFSRLSRNRLRWAVALDRIETAGATLESATEGIDASTSTGRFTRGMLAELEAFRAEQIGDVWKEVKQRRITLGLGDGQPRFGYTRIEKLYVPDGNAQVLADIYLRYGQGESGRSIAAALNRQGTVTAKGNAWVSESVVNLVRTGFGAGLLRSQGVYYPALHEPVVSSEVWQQCLARLAVAPAGERVSNRHTLSGLLLCACGLRLHPCGEGRWRCSGPTRFTGCTGTVAWQPAVLKVIDAWIADLIAGRDAEFQQALKTVQKPPVRVKRRLAVIENDLLALAEKNLRGFYDDDTYLRLRAGLLDEQRLLKKAETPPDYTGLKTVLRGYQDLPEGEIKNQSLRLLLKHVEVRVRMRPKYIPVGRWVV